MFIRGQIGRLEVPFQGSNGKTYPRCYCRVGGTALAQNRGAVCHVSVTHPAPHSLVTTMECPIRQRQRPLTGHSPPCALLTLAEARAPGASTTPRSPPIPPRTACPPHCLVPWKQPGRRAFNKRHNRLPVSLAGSANQFVVRVLTLTSFTLYNRTRQKRFSSEVTRSIEELAVRRLSQGVIRQPLAHRPPKLPLPLCQRGDGTRHREK